MKHNCKVIKKNDCAISLCDFLPFFGEDIAQLLCIGGVVVAIVAIESIETIETIGIKTTGAGLTVGPGQQGINY